MAEKTIDEEHLILLNDAWRRLSQRHEKHLNEFLLKKLNGVTPLELEVLDLVMMKPNIIIKEIRKRLGITGSTLTGIIDRLKDRSFMKRVISQRDRRSFRLEVTTEGKRAHDWFLQSERKFFKMVLSSLNERDDQKNFVALIQKIADNLA
jgi:DNA-binding MarR family transcriptional regulator